MSNQAYCGELPGGACKNVTLHVGMRVRIGAEHEVVQHMCSRADAAVEILAELAAL